MSGDEAGRQQLRDQWWAPIGEAGSRIITDQVAPRDFHTTSDHDRRRVQHRCDVDIAGHPVRIHWHGRQQVVHHDTTPPELIANGAALDLTDPAPGSPVLRVYPVDVLDEPVTMKRVPNPPQRGLKRMNRIVGPFGWQVVGPGGREWSWMTAGKRVVADTAELRRSGDTTPVVTHQIRVSLGTIRGPREVRWTAQASRVEVLLSVMWVLDEMCSDLLPRTERFIRDGSF